MLFWPARVVSLASNDTEYSNDCSDTSVWRDLSFCRILSLAEAVNRVLCKQIVCSSVRIQATPSACNFLRGFHCPQPLLQNGLDAGHMVPFIKAPVTFSLFFAGGFPVSNNRWPFCLRSRHSLPFPEVFLSLSIPNSGGRFALRTSEIVAGGDGTVTARDQAESGLSLAPRKRILFVKDPRPKNAGLPVGFRLNLSRRGTCKARHPCEGKNGKGLSEVSPHKGDPLVNSLMAPTAPAGILWLAHMPCQKGIPCQTSPYGSVQNYCASHC